MMRLAAQRATERYRRKLAILRLQNRGFVRIRKDVLSITTAGSAELAYLIAKNKKQLGAKPPWDRKWRIAAFDIPEKYVQARARVRYILRNAGFEMLQKSIWIFPYDCEELVEFMRNEPMLAPHILYGVLEHIGNDKKWKEAFGLR